MERYEVENESCSKGGGGNEDKNTTGSAADFKRFLYVCNEVLHADSASWNITASAGALPVYAYDLQGGSYPPAEPA